MNRRQRKQQLAIRRQHTDTQNAKRKAGEKSVPRPKHRQIRKPK